MSNTSNNILKLIPEWFIPPQHRQDKTDEHYLRASIVLGVVMLSTLFAIIVFISLYFSPYPENPDQKAIALGIAVLVVLCYLCSLTYYKTRHSIIGASNLYATGVLCATVLPGFITGGFLSSPNLQIVIVVPVWAFLMAGRNNGILWSAISILSVLGYYIADVMGITFPQTIPSSSLATVKFVTWFVAILLVVVCLFIYELNITLLTKRLHKERSKLAHEAAHDSLTGLLNRKSLGKSIDEALENNRNDGSKAAVLYIDLDEFKPINDNYGHAMGDEVLTIVTSRLKACIRASDTVARIGGDEFGVVLHDIDQQAIVTKIANQILMALQQKVVIGSNTFHMSASIGVAYIPEDGNNTDKIISQADKAMYQAKRDRNSICYSASI